MERKKVNGGYGGEGHLMPIVGPSHNRGTQRWFNQGLEEEVL